MKIQLFDRGTPQGKQLFSNLETVCQRLQIDYDPEYIKDMSHVYQYGSSRKYNSFNRRTKLLLWINILQLKN